MNKLQISPTLMVYAAAGAAGLFVAWKLANAAGKGAAAVAEVATQVVTRDLNPANTGNVVNRAVSTVGQVATGDDSWSLGGWLASVTGADRDAEVAAMLKGQQATQAAQAKYQRPTNHASAGGELYSAPLGFWSEGASFKDLADSDGLNPFFTAQPYAGGLNF